MVRCFFSFLNFTLTHVKALLTTESLLTTLQSARSEFLIAQWQLLNNLAIAFVDFLIFLFLFSVDRAIFKMLLKEPNESMLLLNENIWLFA